MSPRFILHVDADAFFASVEQVLRPDLKGRAVIVGGGDRGVVSAASYQARRFGVHSAMPIVRAKRLCPHAVFLSPNFRAYKDFSAHMFAIMRSYSPLVEATSIDEGYVDLTGTLRLHRAAPWEAAHRMLQQIRSELGINVSGGMAGTMTGAKMATGLAKPNGLLYLDPERAQVLLNLLPVGSIPGVGKRAREVLERAGIHTVGDLAAIEAGQARRLLGLWGERLVEIARGDDRRPVRSVKTEKRKSYSMDRTLAADTRDRGFVRSVAREIGETLAGKLRSDGRGASTVTLKLRYFDFEQAGRSMTLGQPTDCTRDILASIDRLFEKTYVPGKPVRQVGVKLAGLDAPAVQMDLFDPARPRLREKDRAVDTIRRRFGFCAVQLGWGTEGVKRVHHAVHVLDR